MTVLERKYRMIHTRVYGHLVNANHLVDEVASGINAIHGKPSVALASGILDRAQEQINQARAELIKLS